MNYHLIVQRWFRVRALRTPSLDMAVDVVARVRSARVYGTAEGEAVFELEIPLPERETRAECFPADLGAELAESDVSDRWTAYTTANRDALVLAEFDELVERCP